MASAAAGWALAMRCRPGTLETCDECGGKTSALYRRHGDFDLRNMVCGVCMDEHADPTAALHWELSSETNEGETE